MGEITIEKLRDELKASIQLNAHDGVESIRLDPESVECMVTAILGSIERLGLGVVPIEPNMEIVNAVWNQAIEACAQATCCYCHDGLPVFFDEEEGWGHNHPTIEGEGVDCDAWAIRSLKRSEGKTKGKDGNV